MELWLLQPNTFRFEWRTEKPFALHAALCHCLWGGAVGFLSIVLIKNAFCYF